VMRINVLPAAPPQVMTMMSYPDIPQESYQWVQDNIRNGMSNLNTAAQGFLNKAMDTYKYLTDGSLTRAARKLSQEFGGLLHPNTIVALEDLHMLQSAKPIMQQYIMAQPDLRAIYHRQLCDGYSETYVDDEPGKIGDDHYYFRRVTHGLIQDVKDDPDKTWRIVEYFDDLKEGDRELTVDERMMIYERTWRAVEHYIDLKLDMTDIFNSDLGI